MTKLHNKIDISAILAEKECKINVDGLGYQEIGRCRQCERKQPCLPCDPHALVTKALVLVGKWRAAPVTISGFRHSRTWLGRPLHRSKQNVVMVGKRCA